MSGGSELSERAQRIAAMYAGGATLRECAETEGVSQMTALRDRDKAGVAARRPEPAPEERECGRDGCRNLFTPTRRQLNNGFGKYCSRKCMGEAQRIYPVPGERSCESCGKRFIPGRDQGWQDTQGWNRYCSAPCAWAAQRGPRTRSTKGQWVPCDNDGCQNQRWAYACELAIPHLEGWFCSEECHAAFRKSHEWPGLRDRDGRPVKGGFLTPEGRVKFLGRVNGHKGTIGGIDASGLGGAPPVSTPKQQQLMYELHGQGQSMRVIAELVFGDARFKDRVARFLNR
jgi:hypothetical protein